jgi:hypothetical protein
MMIKIAACLLAVSFLAGCTTTTTTTKRETVREMTARYASTAPTTTTNEPVPPAEGPEAVGAGPMDPNENPALVPSPLLRGSAIGGL